MTRDIEDRLASERPRHFPHRARQSVALPSQYASDIAPLDAGLPDVYGCEDADGIVVCLVAIRHPGPASAQSTEDGDFQFA
jgi:hypothetical protein